MAFIKVQKLVINDDGTIASGSAAICDTIYGNFGSYHAKHRVRERLGKVLYLSKDRKNGIFLSPTRGLTAYDAVSDSFQPVDPSDERIKPFNTMLAPEIHTVFGDTYLLLEFLEKSGLLSVFQSIFQKKSDYERFLAHVLHGVLKDGSKISCDDFIEKSFASYLLKDIILSSLHTDSRYFSMMGDDHTKLAFFKNFVSYMQKRCPAFGKGCYVDSTPLPNDIMNNPFNALSCHGIAASDTMVRLILVLDETTGLPVWYDIIPGNLPDISTIMNVLNDVAESLGIVIDSLVLDSGYISQSLIEAFHIGSGKTLIGRMPARHGYPFKELYWQVKPLFGKGKYNFIRNHHTYFGKRKSITLFGRSEYAYVYVDQNNALKRYGDYLTEHEEEFAAMKDKDKDWMTVKYGFFILISNLETTPEKLLTSYFERTQIEIAFKTSKEYLEMLPLSKWTDETVRGKILHDIIDTIIVLNLRRAVDNSGRSLSEIYGKTQSLMCTLGRDQIVTVETPNKQVRNYYKLLNLVVPSHVDLNKYSPGILGQ